MSSGRGVARNGLKGSLMRAADKLGAGDPLRALRLSLAPHYVRRDAIDNEHLAAIIGSLLDEDSNCLDVGAHGGQVLEAMLRCAPKGRHIAYEPLPDLQRPLAAQFPTVDVRCAALSREPGTTTFTKVTDALGYSGFRAQDYPREFATETIEVAVESIDASLPRDWVPTLMKIDVEGAERDVLAGGIETITRHRPTVIFEFQRTSAPHYNCGPADIYSLLCDQAKLRIFDIDGGGPYSLNRLEETFEEGQIWNFVAH